MSIQTSLFKRDLALVHTFSSSVHGVSCEFDIIREPCKPKVPSFASEQRDDLVDVRPGELGWKCVFISSLTADIE